MKTYVPKVNRLLTFISAYLLLIFIFSTIISFHKQHNKNVDTGEICLFARQFLSDSYLIKIGEELDCSGFTRYVYRRFDIKIPRSSVQQFKRYAVDNKELEQGDLVFFSSNEKNIGHVGIYLGKNIFIHSPGKSEAVVIDNITDNYWKKRYKGAGSVVANKN